MDQDCLFHFLGLLMTAETPGGWSILIKGNLVLHRASKCHIVSQSLCRHSGENRNPGLAGISGPRLPPGRRHLGMSIT